jgi:hypothetical protein
MKMSKVLTTTDLESLIDGWEYWCPKCRNRTCTIISETERLPVGEKDGEAKFLVLRVLQCTRDEYPLIIGTSVYYNTNKGWGARGQTMTKSDSIMWSRTSMMSSGSPPYMPKEYVEFIEPTQERELPSGLNKKIIASFREAEKAVSKNMPISAAASIRNTVRLIVEDNNINDDNLKLAVKKLPFDDTYISAMSELKIVGDHTLHYEEYKMSELVSALEVLALSLNQQATTQNNLAKLHKATSDKGTKRSREKKTS